MDEAQHSQLAKEYAQQNEAKTVRKHPTRKGRMFDMREHGKVGHPNTKKQSNYGQPWMEEIWFIPGMMWQEMGEGEIYMIFP
jgi:CTP-dependent riboflavin kinase